MNKTSVNNNILITGGAGFIGSHVVDKFVSNGDRVVVLDNFSYCASRLNVNDAALVEHADICNSIDVARILRKHAITSIVHLAAQSHVDNSFGNSLTFTNANVLGTHVLLETWCQYWRENGCNPDWRFLHISTDEVYGGTNSTASGEEVSLLKPTNPYAASKAAAEMFVMAYNYSFQLPIIIARSNNVYGPRQYPEKVIPKFIMRLLNGKKPRIQGSGNQMRSFLYATDAAEAMFLLLKRGTTGKIYNIGVENEVTVKSLATLLTDLICGDEAKQEFAHDQDRPFNDQRYPLDTNRIENEIGWKPLVAFQDGLASTIDWYRQNKDYIHYWTCLPDDLWTE